jgi:hypothetical protein
VVGRSRAVGTDGLRAATSTSTSSSATRRARYTVMPTEAPPCSSRQRQSKAAFRQRCSAPRVGQLRPVLPALDLWRHHARQTCESRVAVPQSISVGTVEIGGVISRTDPCGQLHLPLWGCRGTQGTEPDASCFFLGPRPPPRSTVHGPTQLGLHGTDSLLLRTRLEERLEERAATEADRGQHCQAIHAAASSNLPHHPESKDDWPCNGLTLQWPDVLCSHDIAPSGHRAPHVQISTISTLT